MMGTARGATFTGGGEEGAVAAEYNDEVAVFAQLALFTIFAVGGILDIDAVFFYAQFIQIDGEAVFAQKRNQCVDGILNLGAYLRDSVTIPMFLNGLFMIVGRLKLSV